MIWYYDTNVYGYPEFVLCDIYTNIICAGLGKFYPFRLESKYRYSGILYDKLIHLLNCKYRDIIYDPIAGVGDILYYYTFRLNTNGLKPKIIKETHTTHVTSVRPIKSSIVFNYVYFIKS